MIALSWSRLSTYKQCPLKFYLQFITKTFREEEKGIHLIKGEQLHKQMEDYVNARNGLATMPLGFSPEVQQTIPYVDKVMKLYTSVHPEAQIACREDWTPTEWFAKDTAWRAIWDLTALAPTHVYIGDYKSGKIYPYGEGFGQLHLSAVIGLNKWKEVPMVDATYIYMEHKKITPIKVFRDPNHGQTDERGRPYPHLQQVQEYFDEEFQKVQMEKTWDPTPNDNCKYCQATRAQCKFSRKL